MCDVECRAGVCALNIVIEQKAVDLVCPYLHNANHDSNKLVKIRSTWQTSASIPRLSCSLSHSWILCMPWYAMLNGGVCKLSLPRASSTCSRVLCNKGRKHVQVNTMPHNRTWGQLLTLKANEQGTHNCHRRTGRRSKQLFSRRSSVRQVKVVISGTRLISLHARFKITRPVSATRLRGARVIWSACMCERVSASAFARAFVLLLRIMLGPSLWHIWQCIHTHTHQQANSTTHQSSNVASEQANNWES